MAATAGSAATELVAPTGSAMVSRAPRAATAVQVVLVAWAAPGSCRVLMASAAVAVTVVVAVMVFGVRMGCSTVSRVTWAAAAGLAVPVVRVAAGARWVLMVSAAPAAPGAPVVTGPGAPTAFSMVRRAPRAVPAGVVAQAVRVAPGVRPDPTVSVVRVATAGTAVTAPTATAKLVAAAGPVVAGATGVTGTPVVLPATVATGARAGMLWPIQGGEAGPVEPAVSVGTAATVQTASGGRRSRRDGRQRRQQRRRKWCSREPRR